MSDLSPDAVSGPQPNQVFLRAERLGKGSGRVYVIAFSASDGRGGSCSGTVTVRVPHENGQMSKKSNKSVSSFLRAR